MSEEGELIECRICKKEEALHNVLVAICQQCYDDLNWKALEGPWPWAPTRTRDEFRKDYRYTLEILKKGSSREDALHQLRINECGEDHFASVARSEEAEYQRRLGDDECHDRPVEEEKVQHPELQDEAGPSKQPGQPELTEVNLGQHLDQVMSDTSQRLRAEVRRLYRETLWDRQYNENDTRQEALDYLEQTYRSWTPFFASVAASEDAQFEAREILKAEYHGVLQRYGPDNREAALKWLQENWGSRDRFESVADSEEDDHEEQMCIEYEKYPDGSDDNMDTDS